MNILLDPWQEKFLATTGDKLLCTGRQVGKSVICSKDAGDYAINNKKKVILMIAPTERQAFALFEKTLHYLMDTAPKLIKKGKDRPTQTHIKLHNDTVIHCLPTGIAGTGIRFLTVDRLYADEASRIPDAVWSAVTPMLLTTGGDTILLSTPYGKKGFFWEVINNKDDAFKSFTCFYTSSEEVIRGRPICDTWTELQRDKALAHLEREKSRMSKLEFAQEYEGRPLDELRQFFPDELIRKVMILKRRKNILPNRDYYLGVDIARMGEDESTFEIIHRREDDLLQQVENITTKHTLTTQTTKIILKLEEQYQFKQIFIDDGGMGVGVFDQLLDTDETKGKTIAINNSFRPLDREEKKRKRTLKADLYNNLLRLMETDMIQLLDDDEIYMSLKSVQFEYDGESLRIFGNYTHIAEGIIRAAWAGKDKSLNIWITSINRR